MKTKLNKRKCKFSGCDNTFQKTKPLDMFCSPSCGKKHNDELTEKKASKSVSVKKKGIAPVSDKRLEQLAYYRKQKPVFMAREENKICPVILYLEKKDVPTVDIHHVNGRTGERLNDETYFLAVSRRGHTWIHEHPEESRALGWLI